MTVDPFRVSGRRSIDVAATLDDTTDDVTGLILEARLDLDTDATLPARLSIRALPGPWSVYGQRLRVAVSAHHAGDTAVADLGTYLVRDAVENDDGTVDVEAASLWKLVDDARFLTPREPKSSATLASELDDLLAGILPVDTTAMTDRALPSGIAVEWVEDRRQAVTDIARAWPADLTIDPDGLLVATPPATPTVPTRTWTHGTAGAYITATADQHRDDFYNAVVVRGQTEAGEDVYGYATAQTGPTRFDGPFGRRPRFHYSPLVTTAARARSTAATMLNRELRRADFRTVTAPPDPTITLDALVELVDETGARYTGTVVAASMPLTPTDDSPAVYTVGVGA